MDNSAYVALSRQVALMRDMTVIATNVANIGTTAFRAGHTLFEPVLRESGGRRPTALVQDVGTAWDMVPGPLTATGNPLDVALDGDGWLAFGTADGVRYSRAGHLEIAADGSLVDAAGNPLLDDGGSPIVVPPGDRALTVAPDGTLSNGTGPLGRVGIAAFAGQGGLVPEGGGMWRAEAPPLPGTARIVQGMLEGSNVQPVLEMTRLIETTRAFEGTQRLLETRHELGRKTVERVLAA
ncbi:MAG: flagellar hook-basal body complex protein [Geminicoccaceae bacterium]